MQYQHIILKNILNTCRGNYEPQPLSLRYLYYHLCVCVCVCARAHARVIVCVCVSVRACVHARTLHKTVQACIEIPRMKLIMKLCA